MSILIKSIEMPKNHSYITIAIWPNGIVSYGLLDREGHLSDFQNTKAIPVPPHGRLIDADEFLKRAIGTKCFRGDYALMLEELVGESTTVIPAEEGRDGA